MSHNLLIQNGQASMFYINDVPWHGLGTRLDTWHETTVLLHLITYLSRVNDQSGIEVCECYNEDKVKCIIRESADIGECLNNT